VKSFAIQTLRKSKEVGGNVAALPWKKRVGLYRTLTGRNARVIAFMRARF
jgi:hypothetical protein